MIASWPPTHFSAPLSAEFPSHADWLLPLVDLAYRLPDGSPLVLDNWQRQLLRHILEVYPEGHERAGELRYRQVMVSVARQNGKSVLGAVLALYGLVREAGALVIGIASSADQARIIYSRLLKALQGHPSLARRFQRITDTRGIHSIDGSRYEVKASKSAALQGLDVSLGLVDELHLTAPAMWTDLVNGSRARKNGIVVGITTAGDDGSELLISLYQAAGLTARGDGSVDTPHERFGFFVWEAPSSDIPDDDETLGEYLKAASPALAEGRLDLEVAIAGARSIPPADVVRYLFNRFTASSNAFISPEDWQACLSDPFTRPSDARPVFAFDRTPDWSWATVTAAYKDAEGVIWTEVVASLRNPSIEDLANLATTLLDHNPAAFAVDGYSLRPLAEELRGRGFQNVKTMSQADIVSASALVWGKIRHRRIRHAGDQLLTVQVPRAVRKNVGESWRISRDASTAQIDALMSTVIAAYVADTTTTDAVHQIF